MPNRCDVFFIKAVLSVQAEIDVQSESDSQPIRSGGQFTVQFIFIPGYEPNATAFRAYAFSGDDADVQRTAAQEVIEEDDDTSMDGPAALANITVANYSTLTSFNSEAFSPTTPGSGSSREMGNYTATVPVVTVVTDYWGLLCIIQDTLNHPDL